MYNHKGIMFNRYQQLVFFGFVLIACWTKIYFHKSNLFLSSVKWGKQTVESKQHLRPALGKTELDIISRW